MNEIVIYKTADNSPAVEVNIDNGTIWLSQKQIAAIFFGTEVPAINKHIKNVIKEGELISDGTISKMEIVQQEGRRQVNRNVEVYNLDMIISVGYRVNSNRATQFRIWATQRLKDFLVKGYATNQKRLDQLRQTIQLISQSAGVESLQLQEAKGLLEIIQNYTQSFILLNRYDSHNLQTGELNENITYEIQHTEATAAITELKKQLIDKKEATKLFGNPKDESFKVFWETSFKHLAANMCIQALNNKQQICCIL